MRIQKIEKNQQGIVAIVITIILMLVITLIVLSFAKISRREQRNALDRQLSTQAFYAAESGINDARAEIQSWPLGDARFTPEYTTNCNGIGSFAEAAALTPGTPVALGTAIAGSGTASYTCLFVDTTPPSVEFTASDQQHVLPIRYEDGTSIGNLEIYWDTGGGTNFSGCPTPPTKPTSFTNCDAPILRVELVDADPATLPPEDLTSSKVFFIYPRPIVYPPASPGGIVAYGSTNGSTAPADCNTDPSRQKGCLITITGLNGNHYFMRIRGIYGPAAITIKPQSGSKELIGAQTMIDATGRAVDVERRIQVRVNIGNASSNVPLFGVEGTDKICKKFNLNGTIATDQALPLCWSPATTPN